MRKQQRGNAIIEFCLFTPWLIYMFIAAVDWGFYSYSLISTQAAARIGAVYAASSSSAASDTTTICTYALEQLRKMPNVGIGITSCASGSSISPGAPIGIAVSSVTGTDGSPAAQVSVTYQTPALVPVMTLLPKQATITRTMQMRIYD